MIEAPQAAFESRAFARRQMSAEVGPLKAPQAAFSQ